MTIRDDNRRKCPHCGKRVTRTKAGYLRVHQVKGGTAQCPGSRLMTR